MPRLNYRQFAPAMARYLIAVSIAGPFVAVSVAVVGTGRFDEGDLLRALILTALAAFAERFPLHLTHKTNVNVATAAYVAMVLLLPVGLPGLLAVLAIAAAQVARWCVDRGLEPPEALFNVGQTGLYVCLAALTFEATKHQPLGPELAPFGSLGALVVAATVMHAANTGLVAVAAGLQLGVSPLRAWWRSLALDLTPHVTLSVVGAVAALVASQQLVALLFLALPVVLVHRAVRETIRLRVDTHEALATLIEVVELRDRYTAGHSRRVAATARLLALRLGLTAEEADVIESAGRVHDIGKVALDSAILAKPGRLTEEEWAEVRRHPELGANVLERFAAYQQGAAIVRHHHERWDGSGYPDGLAGEAIPLGARILAVADTFDALTSDRPYRASHSVEVSLSILQDGAGRQWDARVVEAMVVLVQELPGQFQVARRPVTAVVSPAVEAAPLDRSAPEPTDEAAA